MSVIVVLITEIDYVNVNLEFDIMCEVFKLAFGKRIVYESIEFDTILSRCIEDW